MATSIIANAVTNQSYTPAHGSMLTADSLQGAIDQLAAAMAAVGLQIGAIPNPTNALVQMAATLADQQSQVGSLSSDVQQKASASQMQVLANAIAALQTAAQQAASASHVQGIDSSVAALQSQQGTNQTSINSLNSSVAALQAQQSAGQTSMNGLQTQATQAQASISTLQTQGNQNQSAITTLQTQLAQAQSAITALQAQDSQFQTSLSAAQTAITALQNQYAAQQAQIDALLNSFVWKDYQPVLLGATSNPTATYTNRVGRYIEVGKLVLFYFSFQTSLITKSSGLTDALRISLPVACSASKDIEANSAAIVTSVGIAGNVAYIRANSGYLEIGKETLGSVVSLLNYSLTGLGVLNSQITYMAAGVYEKA